MFYFPYFMKTCHCVFVSALNVCWVRSRIKENIFVEFVASQV